MNTSSLFKGVGGDICVAPETVKRCDNSTEVVAGKQLNPVTPSPTRRNCEARQFRSISEGDIVDLPADEIPVLADWLVCLPAWGHCERHGPGFWWEHAFTGDLHCVRCWSEAGVKPPAVALFKNLWESCDGSVLSAYGFVPGQVVVLCHKGRVGWNWPWPNDATFVAADSPQPRTPAEAGERSER